VDDPGYCVHCGSKKKPVDDDRSTETQWHLTGVCPDCKAVRWETKIGKQYFEAMEIKDA